MSGIFNSAIFNNAIFNTGTVVPPVVVEVPQGGGTSRRIRALPQYYSRRIFNKKIQLPQEPHANQVAIEVLDQAVGLIDGDNDDSFHEKLAAVTQLQRIVAAQVSESRAIYDVIEKVKRRIEENVALRAVADEEDEVKELMELM